MHLLMPVMMILCDVACRLSIPSRAVNYDSGDFLVSGWNDIVRDKHLAATEAFLDWVSIGKPRQGSLYDIMKRTRSQFTLALRCCKQYENTLRVDD